MLQLLTGARGVGKTVMLTELGDVARTNGWVVIDVTAQAGMLDRIGILAKAHHEQLGRPSRRSRTTAWKLSTPIGALERESEPADAPPTVWAGELRKLFDTLAPHSTGVCITVDEIHSLDEAQLFELAAEVQHLIREDRPISLVMAGLPKAVEDLLAGDNKPTTFLRRAERPEMGNVDEGDVEDSFVDIIRGAGRSITADLAGACAKATGGYAFMIQLVGYHVWRQAGRGPITESDVEAGIQAAAKRIGSLVHAPALAELSEVDKTFLVHMSRDDGPSRLKDIAERLGQTSQYAGAYRDRLMKAGMIKATGHGYFTFEAPYLREYLRDHAAHLIARDGG